MEAMRMSRRSLRMARVSMASGGQKGVARGGGVDRGGSAASIQVSQA